jgi:TonB-dependent starch-binding outer membrane protein SusC
MRKIAYFLILLFFSLCVRAQERRITGKVIDQQTNEAIAGATVAVKGTNSATQSDGGGNFTLSVPNDNAILIVSYVGMETEEIRIGNQNNLSVSLTSSSANLNEVVVTGYTTERKKDLKGAVAVVKIGEAMKETNANLLVSLQGRVSGVNIVTDGAPGSGTQINIRGISSILGDVQPLYVIDGVPTKDISNISPNDIESMQIMKDAASAAIYGARGANGVVVITTKTGKSSKVKVTLDAFYGVKKLRGNADMLNAIEYGQVLWQQKKNDNQPLTDAVYGTGPSPVIPAFIDDAGTIPSGNVDYIKEVYRPANNMAINLGVAKAAEKSSFYFGININREEGLAKYTLYDRATVRMNSSFKVSNRITVGENLSIGYTATNREPEGRTLEGALFEYAIIPLKDNLGNWGGPVKNLGDRLNPLGQLYLNKDNKTRSWRTFGNVYTDILLAKGLTYHSSFAADIINGGFKGFTNTYTMGRFIRSNNSLNQNTNSTLNLTATNTLTYQLQKGNHDIQALAGYEWINNKFGSFFVIRSGFPLENPDNQFLNGGTALDDANGNNNEYGLIGTFGKINYAYAGKYLFSASLRRDGSSRFGPENRYGTFPAVSGAWRISEETFFQNILKNVSDLKLRASWGKNGNDGIPNYTYATNYSPNVDYSYYDLLGTNGAAQVGYYSTQIGNPSVKWESSVQTNIGLDLGLFNNRFSLTADYYIKRTDDLLYPALTPGARGEGSPPFINVGDIKNSGIELMASYRKSSSGLNYNFDLTFTSIKNRVLKVGKDGNDIRTTARGRIIKGQPVFVFYGHVAEGLFKTQEDVTKHAQQTGKAPGRIRYKDVNADGKIDQNDRTYLGSPFPKFTTGLNAGLSYHDFDVTVFIDANVGNKIYDEIRPTQNTLFFNSNHSRDLLNAWTETNTNSDIPKLTSLNSNDENRTSSFYLKDGSYVRLKSAVIGYNFPKNILDKVHITNFRIFIQGENLFEITKFDGFDFEPSNFEGRLTQQLFPHSRAVTVGLNVGF